MYDVTSWAVQKGEGHTILEHGMRERVCKVYVKSDSVQVQAVRVVEVNEEF